MKKIKTMKVKELMDLLSECSGDALVFVASDEEGNSYSTISIDSIACHGAPEEKVIIIYPWEENVALPGY